MIAMLFGVFDRESYFNLLHELMWTQHGGSGYTFTYADLMDMPVSEMRKWYDKLGERRRSEADAIRRSNK